jgi:iron-sulfur cluster repair protein YtfE (RIC family)
MTQKPLKRNVNIVALSKDHHFTLLFCWKIRQGIKLGADPERMRNYVVYFRDQHMREHFREEEELLFRLVDDEKVAKALDEHKKIFQLTGEVENYPTAQNLQQLADMVDDHVRYEERILFPHLEQTLTPVQLESAGRALAEHPEKPDDFPDTFWLK